MQVNAKVKIYQYTVRSIAEFVYYFQVGVLLCVDRIFISGSIIDYIVYMIIFLSGHIRSYPVISPEL